MANFTAADIKALREKSGAGMLDVKKALEEADGDQDKAFEILRIKGLKGVTKREGRSASNGMVALEVDGTVGTMVEVNCETDFVAKGDKFGSLAKAILGQAVALKATDAQQIIDSTLPDGESVQQFIDDANAATGEKIVVRRVARVEGPHIASYLHKTSPDLPPQIGVLVAYEGDAETAKDVAMHAAAFPSMALDRSGIDAELVENERRVAEATAREEGKPEAALPRIVEGRVGGFFKDNVLLEQAFAKDTKKTVQQVLTEAGTTVLAYARFRVGS